MSQTMEHIVLLNVKPGFDSTKVATMIDEINGLASLGLTLHLSAAKILRSTSNFSHIVHCRFSSADDLQLYNHHPEHLRVARNTQPILDDFVIVDWISNGISCGSLKPGYVMRVMLLKLTDENEKGKLVEGITSWFRTAEQISVGENFLSGEAGKGYSIGMIAVYPDLEAVDSDAGLGNLQVIESQVVVDYAAPLAP